MVHEMAILNRWCKVPNDPFLNLLSAKRQALKKLAEDPTISISHHLSIEDERNGVATTCRLAVIPWGGTWDVWSDCAEESQTLHFEGAFLSLVEAEAFARERADAIRDDGAALLAELKADEWDAGSAKRKGLVGPYEFRDNATYPEGLTFEAEEDVVAFFRRTPSLLRPDEWGNLYWCLLSDGNDERCWVGQGPRGVLRVEHWEM